MSDPAEPAVSVHGARNMSPEAREAVDVLIDIAKRQILEEPPDHTDGPSVEECAAGDRAHWADKYAGDSQ
ncbi:hypothetical protein ABIE67_007886 [Streptomyces sp. V4I8]|uniref:hypothetical protein n=1 Tax=Streptomyces sp. V4I8 TaxID=3156469 RepID=UPI003512369E